MRRSTPALMSLARRSADRSLARPRRPSSWEISQPDNFRRRNLAARRDAVDDRQRQFGIPFADRRSAAVALTVDG